jgi:hypothetical protein
MGKPASNKRKNIVPLSHRIAGIASGPSQMSVCINDPGKVAFCCAYCTCSETGSFAASDEAAAVVHRRCCHLVMKDKDFSTEWCAPSRAAMDFSFHKVVYSNPVIQSCSLSDVRESYKKAQNQATQMVNDAQLPREDSKLGSNEKYAGQAKEFKQRKLGSNEKYSGQVKETKQSSSPAVVLDLFAGIGAAEVVLKRLGIAIQTVSSLLILDSFFSKHLAS